MNGFMVATILIRQMGAEEALVYAKRKAAGTGEVAASYQEAIEFIELQIRRDTIETARAYAHIGGDDYFRRNR